MATVRTWSKSPATILRDLAATLLFCLALPLASPCVAASEDAESGWVEGKLSSMSLREKLGQMLMVDVRGTELTPELASHLKSGAYGNVIFFEWNVVDQDQTGAFIKQLQDLAIVETGTPLLVAVDQEGGPVNRLGALLDMKSTKHSARTIGQVFEYDPSRAERLVGAATAQIAARMRSIGFNMNLAPVLDLTDDEHSYIYQRSYGSNPEAVTRIAGQFADVMSEHGIVTTGKHFPNLSVTRPDSHLALPVLDRTLKQMIDSELVPFRRLRDKLGAIMVGHVVVPAIDPMHPASISWKAGRLLRQKIGYQGVVISDDIKMKALSGRYTLTEVMVRALSAEVDMLIVAWGKEKQRESLDVLEQLVKRGKIPVSRVDRSVRRILKLKERYAR